MMPTATTLPSRRRLSAEAYAKINLRLEVHGRRTDGYHEIVSLMHPIDLADTVTVTLSAEPIQSERISPPAARGRVVVDCPAQPNLNGPKNLAGLAAAAWLEAWDRVDPTRHRDTVVHTEIAKRIPVAAGLGGGSADAAAVLGLLQAIDPLPETTMAQLAAVLGADVPYFRLDRPAVARGKGERLTPIRSLLQLPLLLGMPTFGISSADAYRWWDERVDEPAQGSDCLAPFEAGAVLNPTSVTQPGFVHNDLTRPVIGRYPVVGELIEAIRRAGARGAEMTGSGSAVYGLFTDDAEQAARAAALLAGKYPCIKWRICRLSARTDCGEDT